MSDTPCPSCGYCPTCGHRMGDNKPDPWVVVPTPPVIITPPVAPWPGHPTPYVGTPYPFPGGTVTVSHDSRDDLTVMNAMSSIVSSVVDSLSRPLMFNRVAA